MNKLIRYFCLGFVLLLSGCGFHLRGDAGLPIEYQNIQVTGPAVVTEQLQLRLNSSESTSGASPLLSISNERIDRRVMSVDPNSGRVREIQLSYLASYKLKNAAGEIVAGPSDVRLTRDYIFDETAVAGSSFEERVLTDEMRRDAAEQIIRTLRAQLVRP